VEIADSYIFQTLHQTVWHTVSSAEILATILPGFEELEKIDDNSYKAKIKVKIGPVYGFFNGEAIFSNVIPHEGYHVHVKANGRLGSVEGMGRINLQAENNKTILHYTGTVELGGWLAWVGWQLLNSAMEFLIGKSLDRINQYFHDN